jgi:hypothetical protein
MKPGIRSVRRPWIAWMLTPCPSRLYQSLAAVEAHPEGITEVVSNTLSLHQIPPEPPPSVRAWLQPPTEASSRREAAVASQSLRLCLA